MDAVVSDKVTVASPSSFKGLQKVEDGGLLCRLSKALNKGKDSYFAGA